MNLMKTWCIGMKPTVRLILSGVGSLGAGTMFLGHCQMAIHHPHHHLLHIGLTRMHSYFSVKNPREYSSDSEPLMHAESNHQNIWRDEVINMDFERLLEDHFCLDQQAFANSTYRLVIFHN